MTERDTRSAVRRRIEATVRRYVDLYNLLAAEAKALVAVSGGPDSTALLLILSRLAKNRSVELNVAYFDHGLRGPAVSDAEREFVRGLAASFDLPFFPGRGD